MFYLISQLLLLLAIASLLSGAIGWICRRFISDKAHSEEIRGHQRAGRRQVAEIDDLRRELTDRNSQVAGLHSRLQENQDELDRADHEREQLLDDLHHLRGLENEFRAVNEDLARIDQERANAEAALRDAQKADQDRAQQLLAANTAAGNLEDVIASLNKDLANKVALGEAANRKHAELSAQINQLQAKLADSEKANAQQVGGLEKSLRDEKDKLSAAKEMIASGEQKLKGLEALLAERTKERDKLENLADNKQREIAALQQEITRLQNEAAEAKTNNNTVVAGLEHALDKQRTLVDDANKQVANEEKAKGKLQGQLDSVQRDLKDALAAGEKRSAKANEVLEQQKAATGSANSAKAALENELKELKRQHAELQKSANGTQDKLHSSEKESAKLAEKIAAAERKIADLEAKLQKVNADADANEKRFQREMSGRDQVLTGKDGELRDALNQISALQEQLAGYQSSDEDLRALIVNLQTLLSEERRLAGQSLLSRIKELEAMLEAERRKADELREIPAVSDISWRSQTIVRSSAANTSSVDDKKTGT